MQSLRLTGQAVLHVQSAVQSEPHLTDIGDLRRFDAQFPHSDLHILDRTSSSQQQRHGEDNVWSAPGATDAKATEGSQRHNGWTGLGLDVAEFDERGFNKGKGAEDAASNLLGPYVT